MAREKQLVPAVVFAVEKFEFLVRAPRRQISLVECGEGMIKQTSPLLFSLLVSDDQVANGDQEERSSHSLDQVL